MINDKKLFFPLIYSKNICCGYLLESPQRCDSNKYPQHMFLGVLNTIFLNISNYLPHLELRNHSIQTVVIANFVVLTNVGIKQFDCSLLSSPQLLLSGNFDHFFFYKGDNFCDFLFVLLYTEALQRWLSSKGNSNTLKGKSTILETNEFAPHEQIISF